MQKMKLAILLLCLAACLRDPASTATLKAEGDVVTIEVTSEHRAETEAFVAKLDAVQHQQASLFVADLVRIVNVDPADIGVFTEAYPNPLAVTCDAAVCKSSGTGAAARARTIATSDDLIGISIGVRTAVSSSFQVLEPGVAIRVCDVDGVYFSKLLIRKNLKAFEIKFTPTSGTATVWLAGATGIPTCGGNP